MKTNHRATLRVDGIVRTTLSVLTVFILVFTTGIRVTATTVQRLNLDDLVLRSETIIVGRVVDSHSSWTKDGKLILTQTTVEVQERLKGPVVKSVQVTTIGGQVGKTILQVSGLPAFTPNETAVIFLERSNGYLTVLGLNQGKFSIRDGQVTSNLTGLSFSDGATNSKFVRLPLDEFKRQIQQRLYR